MRPTGQLSELGGKKKKQEREYTGLCLQNVGVGQNNGRTYGRKGDRCFSSRNVLRLKNERPT